MATVLGKTFEPLDDAWSAVPGVATGSVDSDGKWIPAGPSVELGYKELTSISTSVAVGLADVSGGIPAGARRADVEVKNATVHWRADGTDPTTSVGRLLNPGDILEYDGSDLTKLKLIGVSAGATLCISFTA